MAADPPAGDDYTLEERDDSNAGPARPAPVAPDADELVPKERYAAREPLGVGGMGEVLLVHDHLIGRDVALKQLRRETGRGRRRFAREARVQGQLEHPAVVPV